MDTAARVRTYLHLRFLVALGLFGILAFPGSALAEDTPVGVDSPVDSVFDLDPFTVNLIFAVLLPSLVGLVTKASTDPRLKAVLLAFLSAAAGVITVTAAGGAFVSEASLKAAFLQFVTAVAVHFGLLKPTGVSAKLQATAVKD